MESEPKTRSLMENRDFRALCLFVGIVVCLLSAACSMQTQGSKAPKMDPVNCNAIARYYMVTKIDVGKEEVCPIDNEGRLIIFSEDVYSNSRGSKLFVDGKIVSLDETFIGPDWETLPNKVKCNGKFYNAVHVCTKIDIGK